MNTFHRGRTALADRLRTLAPLLLVVLGFVVAACKNSGGGTGY